jgi:hypothetical protein
MPAEQATREIKEAKTAQRTGILHHAIRLVSCLLILLPAALALLYVRAFGVSVVFADAWSMVPLFNKWSSGRLGISDLFAQHLEHRMFFPKSVELFLGNLTKYDNVAEMYLIQVCLLATLVILLLAFRGGTRAWLLLFVPVSLLVFSFRQYDNMLWGYQISFAFTQTFGVLAFFLLDILRRKGLKKSAFIAAVGCGTVASFSTVQGLFVWPAGLFQLLVSPLANRARKVSIALWSLVGLGEWIAYFVDYEKPPNTPSLLYGLEHPATGTKYFLSLLGSSLFWEPGPAFVGGLLLACLVLASLLLLYKDKRLGEYSFWLSLMLYSSLILASITLGRSGFGVEQAMVSRYTTFSILAVIGVYAVLARTALEKRLSANAVLLVALLGVILLSAVVSYSKGIEAGHRESLSREKAAFVLSTYETQPDELLTKRLNPSARLIRKRAPVLQRLGYNVFSEAQARGSLPPLSTLSPVSSSTPSRIDAITGPGVSQQDRSLVVVEEESFIQLAGWAVDANNESTAGGVYLDVDGELFPAFYGSDRQDIADSLGIPSYRHSGFERALPVSEIGAGTHELSIIVLTSDMKGYYQSDRKAVLEVR